MILKIKYIILFIIFASAKNALSIDYDFSGYLYTMNSVQKIPEISEIFPLGIDDDYIFLNYSRLRLTPEIYFDEEQNIYFTLHYEANLIYSKVELPYFGPTGKTNRQVVDLSANIIDRKKVKVDHFIDRAFFTYNFQKGKITAGRQRIAWGVGRVWQPTDMFNPINPANYNKIEKDGADAVSFKYYAGDFTDIEFVANFREKLNKTNFGTRFRTNFYEYDVSVLTGYFDDKAVIGSDFEGNFFDAGLRGEAVYTFDKERNADRNVRMILGIDYQFTDDLYALAEYQFNGEGTTDKNEYLKSFQRLIDGEIQNLSRNYLAIQANYQVHPLVGLSIISISNLNDRSGFTGIVGNYSALEDLAIGLGTMFFFGEKFSEYWYYSTAAYLTAQYYF